jgi:hypothetical protein
MLLQFITHGSPEYREHRSNTKQSGHWIPLALHPTPVASPILLHANCRIKCNLHLILQRNNTIAVSVFNAS